MIVPLCIKGKDIHIFGDFGNEEILDFIYPDSVQVQHFEIVLTELRRKFKGYKLVLNRLAPDSLLCAWLDKNNYRSLPKKSYAHLRVASSYEDYFRQLPAEIGENIGRAEKFMEQMGVPYQVKFNRGSLDKETKKQGVAILNQKATGSINMLRLMTQRYGGKHFNALTDACTNESNSFNACLYINDKMTAFASGFFDLTEKRLFIRKVGIDNNYAKDLIWLFLHTQMIKWSIENSTFEWVDFADIKKKYRNWLGCEDYCCRSYEIEL